MLGLKHGNGEMEMRALPNFAVHPDAAAMSFDEMLSDGKAQTRSTDLAGARDIDSVETFKNAGLVHLGNADARVRNGESDFLSVGNSRNLDPASGGRVLNGIVEQVLQNLGKTAAVGGNIRESPLQIK